MPQEIERKFLVNEAPPHLNKYRYREILQGYVTEADARVEVRVRKQWGQCYLTLKSGTGLQREEVEIEITASQFNLLWPLTENRRIRKVRYEIPYQETLIELDIYADPLDRLMTAEIEFENQRHSTAFVPPAWIGDEVTEDERFKNKNLAIFGTPKNLKAG
ncbi:CYTH domain-containing protein [bacterium]|nr:CYTH domain-containing protein [bacterium]